MAELENRQVVEKHVYDERKKHYASKGEALGVGIPALVLGGLAFANQMMGGKGFGLFGGANGANAGANAISVEMARETDIAEKQGLYKSMRDLYDVQAEKMNTMGFELYKSQRDLYDTLNERYAQKVCDLEQKVAVMEATRPYQEALMRCEIEKAFNGSLCYTDKKTCRMVTGVVGIPSATTTVIQGASPYCNCPVQG